MAQWPTWLADGAPLAGVWPPLRFLRGHMLQSIPCAPVCPTPQPVLGEWNVTHLGNAHLRCTPMSPLINERDRLRVAYCCLIISCNAGSGGERLGHGAAAAAISPRLCAALRRPQHEHGKPVAVADGQVRRRATWAQHNIYIVTRVLLCVLHTV